MFFKLVSNNNNNNKINKFVRNVCLKAMPTGSEFWHFTSLNITADWNGIIVSLFSRHKNRFWALHVSESTCIFISPKALPGLRSLASEWVRHTGPGKRSLRLPLYRTFSLCQELRGGIPKRISALPPKSLSPY